MTEILDSQMNLGKNLFGPDSTIEDYLKNAHEQGVVKTILIPTGTHELILPDGTIEQSCIWSVEAGKICFKRILLDSKRVIIKEEINPERPYEHMNKFCYEKIKELNSKQNEIEFYFAPKIHPQLDTEEEVEKYLFFNEVVAFKVQGISSYTKPEDIPSWLQTMLKKHELPLMVHTDYRGTPKGDDLDKLIKENTATNWTTWAIKNDIKLYLAHGLRLDPIATDLVNKSDLFLIGLGPDLMLNTEKDSLVVQDKDYLTQLFNTVSHEKTCFNYDYRWNVHKRGSWDELDWKTPERIIRYAKNHGLNETFLTKVFFNNAIKYFSIGDKK